MNYQDAAIRIDVYASRASSEVPKELESKKSFLDQSRKWYTDIQVTDNPLIKNQLEIFYDKNKRFILQSVANELQKEYRQLQRDYMKAELTLYQHQSTQIQTAMKNDLNPLQERLKSLEESIDSYAHLFN